MPKLSPYNTRVTMWAGNLAPDHPNLRPPNLLLCTVHESDLLTSVECCCFCVVNSLDLDEAGTRRRISLSSLVAKVLALHI